MTFKNSIEFALELDKKDPLASIKTIQLNIVQVHGEKMKMEAYMVDFIINKIFKKLLNMQVKDI